MAKVVLTVRVNDVDFYCERRGTGLPLVLIPDGVNDCEHYSAVGDLLSDEFSVLTFDMRGGTRSMPEKHVKVTPKILAGDVAGIIKALDMAPASIYGCSSGGQTALAVGKYYPEVAVNLIAHEAALMADTPIPNTGFDFFDALYKTFGPMCDGFSPRDVSFVCNWDNWKAFGDDFLRRAEANTEYWAQYIWARLIPILIPRRILRRCRIWSSASGHGRRTGWLMQICLLRSGAGALVRFCRVDIIRRLFALMSLWTS